MTAAKPFEIGGPLGGGSGSASASNCRSPACTPTPPVVLPVQVVNGKDAGPRIFVSAALHGDEIIGVEIIRRLLKLPALDGLRGTLVAVPVVNTLPSCTSRATCRTGSTLNRSFPGSESGSLGGAPRQPVHQGVVSRCDYGIDLQHRRGAPPNLPQIRGDLANPRRCACAARSVVPLCSLRADRGHLARVHDPEGHPGDPVRIVEARLSTRSASASGGRAC